ncbi:hypothetical protein [Zhihengliuella salsuginis]|uniref:Transcriptional regulator n=1 Tax=Zhihengliuella salsuginis TaxID=578222 RepID=A0ABQ3GMG5_9MICC|nr:hypothetical protein [Zhihengliuella salsuginis]GHD12646.1 transcriptional regulator [Zhihengliuella salsuginis]
MLVLTIDQRHSRSSPDLVGELIDWIDGACEALRPFERTAGDEVQGVLPTAESAVQLALDIVKSGEWSVGIGVGAVEEPLPAQTRAGRGEAFERARDAVERAKTSSGRVAVTGPPLETERLEAELQMIAAVNLRRTKTSEEAGQMIRSGMTQQEVAVKLGISQQAVSSRLSSGLWYETQRLTESAIRALEELDGTPGGRQRQPAGRREANQ